MNTAEPIILWELTRALASVAAWYVLFYRLHRPDARWRRIALLVAMPGAYLAWILAPMSVLGNGLSWAAITVVLALLCGDLRRTLFTAGLYIGMEASIDNTRSALVALINNGFFPAYSTGYYLQYNIQYLMVFGVALIYCAILKRRARKPPLASWILTIVPPFGLWAILTYYAVIADPLLRQGINIYGPGLWFGIFSVFYNLVVFAIHTRLLVVRDSQALAIEVAHAPPVWTAADGLAPGFCERYGLTEREEKTMSALMQGKANQEIAEALCISRKTVEFNLTNIYRKTGAPNRFALYALIKGVN